MDETYPLCLSFYKIGPAAGWYCNSMTHFLARFLGPLVSLGAMEYCKRILIYFFLNHPVLIFPNLLICISAGSPLGCLQLPPFFYWGVLTRQGSDGSWPDGSYLSWHFPSVNNGVPVSTQNLPGQ